MIVDRYNFQPIYYQLAEKLRAHITAGELAKGGQLPPEEELCRLYEVSRNTIRSALKKLENEGMIYRVKGKGTFASPVQSKLRNLIIVLSMLPHGHHSIQSLLSGTIIRAQEAGAQLQVITDNQLEQALENARHNTTLQTGVAFLRDKDISEEKIAMVEKFGMPCIVEGDRNIAGYNFIDIDNRDAMIKIVDHLYGLGHRRFGIFNVIDRENCHFQQRTEAVFEHLAQLGIPHDPSRMVSVDYRSGLEKNTYAAAGDFFRLPDPPTAIICVGDNVAAELIRWCHHHHYRIPEQLSVTGFDDIESSRFIDPKLTTIRQDYYELGYMTADYLLKMMDNFVNRRIQLKVKLEMIVRDSTGPAPSA